ncbi:MAG: hypothetical protein Q4C10_06315 [Clostridia bacterium]|nr:hypothetical protein [Clostridia bacterium]
MAEMKRMDLAITVDDGSRRVPILNVDGEEIGAFTFRPTDIGIVERFNRLADSFDRITEPLEAIPDDAGGGEADVVRREALAEAEKRLYAAVNELFGGDAAGAFFGRMHPFSPVNGAFYCEQVLGVVGKFISDQFDAETAKFKKRVAKYARGAKQ